MKKVVTVSCFIFLLGAIFHPAVGQKRTKSNQKAARTARTFDYGTTAGQIYSNNFLGLKFIVPENWEIEKREKPAQNFPNVPKILLFAEFSEKQTKRYASFLCAARKIPATQKNLSAKNALEEMISEPEEGVSKTVLEEKLGLHTLPYIEKISAENKKRMYSITKNGYLILFSFMYFEDRDLEIMKQILVSADLDWGKS